MSTDKQIKVGVVGAGYWGPKLVRNFTAVLHEGMAAVVDRDETRLAEIKAQFPHLRCYQGLSEMLDDDGHPLDAVAIATPVSTHFDLAMEAIARGKHVLVEKPMTDSSESSWELVEAAEKQGVTLMVDHTFVFTGAVRKIREVVAAGDLGDIFYFDSVRVNLGLFQHDINVLWDLAPHDLSIMEYALQRHPVAVAAHGASHIAYSSKPIENIVYLTVFFEDDLIGHVHVNWLAPVKVRQTLIGGSRKMIVYDDNLADEKVKIYDTGVDLSSEERGPEVYRALIDYRTGDMWAPKLDKSEALKMEVRHFVECCRGEASPVTDGAFGARVVSILEAAEKSLANGGKRVELKSRS